MKMDDFQQQALQSVAITDKTALALAHRALGMSGEVGIVSNITKKIIRDRNGKLTDEDRALLKEKIGDVMYYAAVLADYADLSLDEIAAANLQKSAEFKSNRS
jgi:NTP pyrophosphatase (non-canonical NTP hydrolase)